MMRFLYSMPFCPFARKILFGLREKGLEVTEVYEYPWSLSPTSLEWCEGGMPVLRDAQIVCYHHNVICEYLEDMYPMHNLLGETPSRRLDVREWVSFFDETFYKEVFLNLFYEKLIKNGMKKGTPDVTKIRHGLQQLDHYLKILDRCAEQDVFLVGRLFSWVDIAAASHLSCLDYLGHIPWSQFPSLKEWYMKIKCRPTFRPFLKQSFLNTSPSSSYRLLDF